MLPLPKFNLVELIWHEKGKVIHNSAHLHFAAADRVHVISEVRRLLTITFIKIEVPSYHRHPPTNHLSLLQCDMRRLKII